MEEGVPQTGAFSDVFGYIPKVTVLEAFAENPDAGLSASEVARISGVSKRAAYLIVKHYLRAGLLKRATRARGSPRTYSLNPNDLRATTIAQMESLLVLGGIQTEIKRQRGIPFTEPLPPGIVSRMPIVWTSLVRIVPTPVLAQSPSPERILSDIESQERPWPETTSSQSRSPVTIEVPNPA